MTTKDIANAQLIENIGLAIAKFLLFLFLSYQAYILVTAQEAVYVFLDYVNFFIHEGGHIVFGALHLGEFMTIAGGTIAEVLVPGIIFLYFLFKKQYFSVFFCLYWMGDALVSIHFYIADTLCRCLTYFSLSEGINSETLTPDAHDWYYLLNHFGITSVSITLAKIVYWMGTLLLIASLIFMLFSILIMMIKKPKICRENLL